jgi:hypothetical protein
MINDEERARLLEELSIALTCAREPDMAEALRLTLWNWLDKRQNRLHPSTDRRSVIAREHLAKLGSKL